MDIHSTYPIGTVVTLGREFISAPPGSPALVFEHYTLSDHKGISLIASNGDFDGFSQGDLANWEVKPERFDPQLASYQFTNVGQLTQDYRSGLFDEALTSEK